MDETQYLALILKSLLTSDAAKLKSRLEELGRSYEIEKLQKPQAVSIGFEDHLGQPYSLVEGLKLIHLPVEEVHLATFDSQETALPSNVAAAFANTEPYFLLAKSKTQNLALRTRTDFSPDKKMTPEIFTQLLQAQSQPELFKKIALDQINSSLKLNNLPLLSFENFSEELKKLSSMDWMFFSGQLLQEVQVKGLARGLGFIMPDHLAKFFIKYPSDQKPPDQASSAMTPEQLEVEYRGFISGGGGYYAAPNDENWRCVMFLLQPLKVGADPLSSLSEKLSLQQSIKNYSLSLKRAMKFAQKEQLENYKECFQITSLIADSGFSSKLPQVIKAEKVSELGWNVFEKYYSRVGHYEKFGFQNDELLAMLLLDMTNVFGGMGSWNDMGFTGEAAAEYDKVTKDLFEARTNLFYAIFS